MKSRLDVLVRAREALDRLEESVGTISPERERGILEHRAEIAAGHRQAVSEVALRAVVFTFGGDRFAVDLRRVTSVGTVRTMTPIPGAAPGILGVVGLRNRVLTAIDVFGFIGASSESGARRLADADKAIAIENSGGDREIVLIAEELLGVHEFSAAEIRPLDGAGREAPVHELGPEGAQILDVDTLFRDPRLSPTGRR